MHTYTYTHTHTHTKYTHIHIQNTHTHTHTKYTHTHTHTRYIHTPHTHTLSLTQILISPLRIYHQHVQSALRPFDISVHPRPLLSLLLNLDTLLAWYSAVLHQEMKACVDSVVHVRTCTRISVLTPSQP